jgi:xanthine dehydrogenase YagS FAD-binding subunit
MCVAMAALDAKVEVEGPKVKRTISFAEFHKLPGAPPWIETTLRADELIVSVTLPPPKFAKNAYYLKARDRNSYAFALISVAAGLEMDGEHVRSADLALGGVALKPWRRVEAEKVLVGCPGDSISADSVFWISVGRAEGARRFLVSADVAVELS